MRELHAGIHMKKVLKNYSLFLRVVGDLFAHAAARNRASCKRGCHACCTGLFAISPLDALHLRESLGKVSTAVRKRILRTANEQLDHLEGLRLFSRDSPLMKSDTAIDAIARRSADLRCPALDSRNRCMIYEYRPLICRTFGPTVRGARRSVLAEGCGDFLKDITEKDFPIPGIYKDEDVLLKALFEAAGHGRVRRFETIIPAALALDMRKWLERTL